MRGVGGTRPTGRTGDRPPLVLGVLLLLPLAGASAIAFPLALIPAPIAREKGLAAGPLRGWTPSSI
ncbi:MAG: hypothetical protein M3P49_00935 [Actinomycetota bacterium]|nr:hypothetical protein [Actinomycetota bacterium]